MSRKIKVHIVDDSAVVREVLTDLLGRISDIQVIAASPDPVFALDKMNKQWPDVIVLDIEMPRMDGLTFLRKIMKERPTPVIICSSLAEEGMSVTLDAMAAGAVSIVAKPKLGLRNFLNESSRQLIDEVRAAAGARVSNLTALEPFRPLFIGAALVALYFAWRRIYRTEQKCNPDDICALPAVRNTYKTIFWVVAALVLIALSFPYVLPFFY